MVRRAAMDHEACWREYSNRLAMAIVETFDATLDRDAESRKRLETALREFREAISSMPHDLRMQVRHNPEDTLHCIEQLAEKMVPNFKPKEWKRLIGS
jgi:hypothetical protein